MTPFYDTLPASHPELAVGQVYLETRSPLGDVISIRARPQEDLLRHSIVDECGTVFQPARETSQHPFTLAGLIEFIDHSIHPVLTGSLALAANEWNAKTSTRANYRYFTRIVSDLYPQLNEH